ncbi:hypothetical protein CHS0354_011496, partial [Potamilus streckersoni]
TTVYYGMPQRLHSDHSALRHATTSTFRPECIKACHNVYIATTVHYGMPQRLHSDLSALRHATTSTFRPHCKLESKVIGDLYQITRINKFRMTPYHLMDKAMCE